MAGAIATRIGAMHIAPADEPGKVVSHDDNAAIADARRMTRAQLRQLGVAQLVYLRAGVLDGETAFAIHAADGTALAVVEDIELAVELVSEQGMAFVAVH
jgi:hypothetical protein